MICCLVIFLIFFPTVILSINQQENTHTFNHEERATYILEKAIKYTKMNDKDILSPLQSMLKEFKYNYYQTDQETRKRLAEKWDEKYITLLYYLEHAEGKRLEALKECMQHPLEKEIQEIEKECFVDTNAFKSILIAKRIITYFHQEL